MGWKVDSLIHLLSFFILVRWCGGGDEEESCPAAVPGVSVDVGVGVGAGVEGDVGRTAGAAVIRPSSAS